MMKSREEIITEMCFTFRHDYGLPKSEHAWQFEAGMTDDERQFLYSQMAQIYDNDLSLYIDEYRRLKSGESVLVPVDRSHAENMLKMASWYLENHQ